MVAECANLEGKEVTFKIYEKEALLVEKDKELPVLQKDVEVTEIKATVKDGYAVAEIELQKVEQGKYADWNTKLDPDEEELKTSELYIKVGCEDADFTILNRCFLEGNNREFKVSASITIYDIYHNHRITKIQVNHAKKCRYIYHDNSNKKHSLGKLNLKEVNNLYHYGDEKYGGKTVKLININDLQNYSSGSVSFNLSINTNRYYINEDTLASLLGAMLECGYKDYSFNGFSNEIGKSIGGSKTHKSGYNGDLRYLRKDKTGGKLNLGNDQKIGDVAGWKELDINRQEKFNDALYNFGWKSMISQKYGEKNKKKLLRRCTEDKKNYQHYDHLHIQGYKNNFIKTIKIYE